MANFSRFSLASLLSPPASPSQGSVQQGEFIQQICPGLTHLWRDGLKPTEAWLANEVESTFAVNDEETRQKAFSGAIDILNALPLEADDSDVALLEKVYEEWRMKHQIPELRISTARPCPLGETVEGNHYLFLPTRILINASGRPLIVTEGGQRHLLGTTPSAQKGQFIILEYPQLKEFYASLTQEKLDPIRQINIVAPPCGPQHIMMVNGRSASPGNGFMALGMLCGEIAMDMMDLGFSIPSIGGTFGWFHPEE